MLKYKIAELEHNSHVMTGKLRDTESLLENTQRELLDKKEKDPEGSLVFTRKSRQMLSTRARWSASPRSKHWSFNSPNVKTREGHWRPPAMNSERKSVE